MKRIDGRHIDDLRPIEAKTGVIKRADGSAYFKIGKTVAYAAVYGPKNLYPRFLQDPKQGLLRVNYNMMPFSGSGERIKPGSNRRAKEISMVTEKAFMPVVNLNEFPNSVVDVFIELPQTDAGTRCAGICAASMALADAGISMKDLVTAIAVGNVNGQIVADLSKDEEDVDDAVDIPVAVIPSTGEVSLLQMDGMITKEKIMEAIALAKKVAPKINKILRETIKKKYEVELK